MVTVILILYLAGTLLPMKYGGGKILILTIVQTSGGNGGLLKTPEEISTMIKYSGILMEMGKQNWLSGIRGTGPFVWLKYLKTLKMNLRGPIQKYLFGKKMKENMKG